MTKKARIITFVLTGLSCIGCDRVTKDLAKTHLQFEAPKSYLNNFFRLEYVENTGAALSLGDNLPQPYNFILLSLLPIIFMVGLTFYVMRNISTFNKLMLLSLSLIIAGGLGNIIDRILYDRHVTDFMNMGIGNVRTGIFNVADICVTAGAIGILLSYKSQQKLPPATA
ncbi:signal peptidase II [Mucilaginibacter limnophilus]|uniref:Lipoprotein signal peptidase n=1 Tax=Mucilaginibacter limnophilus TaxID=1932778 RepID=A0A437MKT3_9SPHI|nr:signal peptidase II [Mucilaginibacter limnophilus]RVT98216.1 signal peptidase II [Mucilaginibacter limnophilus]